MTEILIILSLIIFSIMGLCNTSFMTPHILGCFAAVILFDPYLIQTLRETGKVLMTSF
jgi:hypothetical protein